MLPIITTPNPTLLKQAEEVSRFDKKLKQLIHEMSQTLLATVDPKGVGLAAPQVGILKRLFLAKPTEKAKISVFINPKITSESDEIRKRKAKNKLLEGCLSIPNVWGKVNRKRKVAVTYQDLGGKHYTKEFTGFLATIIQHEIDHLDGILFTKHALEQGETLYRSYKNEKGEDEFEEIKV